jgi:hypothetical protein
MLRLLVAVAILFTACGQTGSPVASRSAQPSPSQTASPTPLSTQVNVPDSTPLILYHDPANFDQLDGTTWDGALRGKVGSGVTNGGIPNSAGTRFTVGGDVYDRTGRVVANIPLDGKSFSGIWADDQAHYCGVARISPDAPTNGEPGTLQVALPGEKPRDITRIGTFYPRGFDAGGPRVAACSLQNDLAIVAESGGQGIGTVQFWAIQLSTGRVLWSHKPAASDTGVILAVASPDGRYVAENHGAQSGPQATIYGPDGAAVAHFAGWVEAFSWNGSLAVVGGTWTGGPVKVFRWRDQETVWAGPAGTGYGYWQGVAEPGGTRLALGLRDPEFPQTGGFAPVDLYVVSADGTVGFERKNTYLFTP